MHLHIFSAKFERRKNPNYEVTIAPICPIEEVTQRYSETGAKTIDCVTSLLLDSAHSNLLEIIKKLRLADTAFERALSAGLHDLNAVILVGTDEQPLTLTFEANMVRIGQISSWDEVEQRKQSSDTVYAPIRFSEILKACDFCARRNDYFDVCYALWHLGKLIAQGEVIPQISTPVYAQYIKGDDKIPLSPDTVFIHFIRVKARNERPRRHVIVTKWEDYAKAHYCGLYEWVEHIETLQLKGKEATLLHILLTWEIDLMLSSLIESVWKAGETRRKKILVASKRENKDRLQLFLSEKGVELEGRRLIQEAEIAYPDEHLFDFLEKAGQTKLFLQILHDLWLQARRMKQ